MTTTKEKGKIGVELDCAGEAKNMIRFLYRIAVNESRLVKIEKLTLLPKGNLVSAQQMLVTQVEIP